MFSLTETQLSPKLALIIHDCVAMKQTCFCLHGDVRGYLHHCLPCTTLLHLEFENPGIIWLQVLPNLLPNLSVVTQIILKYIKHPTSEVIIQFPQRCLGSTKMDPQRRAGRSFAALICVSLAIHQTCSYHGTQSTVIILSFLSPVRRSVILVFSSADANIRK